MADKISRQGTARALVLLASVLAVAGAALLCALVLVFGGSLHRPGLAGGLLAGAATFGGFALVSALVANLLAARAKSLKAVVARGCGTLLVGVVLGVGVMLLLISHIA